MDYKEILPAGQLAGTVAISGAKNSALLLLAATVLLDKPVILNRVPDISDVRKMCDILGLLNVKIRWMGDDALLIDPTDIQYSDLKGEVCGEIRTSVLFLGSLLGKLGRVKLRAPGGCRLGPRPINYHVSAMEAMGAEVVQEGQYVSATLEHTKSAVVNFPRSTVTGTVNAILCAVSIKHLTLIHGAALEPEIDDLIGFLVQAGAKITRAGHTIEVIGGFPLATSSYRVMPDRIEAGTFLIAGAILGGDLVVADVVPQHLNAVISALKQAGAEIEVGESTVSLKMMQKPCAVNIIAREYPFFPTDLQPQWCVLSIIAKGDSTIVDSVFPERFDHMHELEKIGAKYKKNAEGVVIQGGLQLDGGSMYAGNLRSAAALVLGAMSARLPSKIVQISILNRGYPGFFLKINNILSD